MTIDVLKPSLRKYGTKRQKEYLDAVLKYGSNTKAAEVMGVDRRTVDRSIAALKNAAIEAGEIIKGSNEPKVMFLDIETAPMLANIWSLWSEPRNTALLMEDWYIMSFGWKWMGEKLTHVNALPDFDRYQPGSENDKELVYNLWLLLNKADYVITHNGDNFDIKRINTRFLENGIGPPLPYKSIDTLKIAKRTFQFTSNKLDYLAQKLLGEKKREHDGIKTWQQCIAGDPKAWETMIEYNRKDVDLLEQIYYRLRAWDHLHPSFAVHSEQDVLSCTVCGSVQVRPTGGTVKTSAQKYLGYECLHCGHQMRGRTSIRKYAQKQSTLMNAK